MSTTVDVTLPVTIQDTENEISVVGFNITINTLSPEKSDFV